MAKNVALVVGATGIVGGPLVELLLKPDASGGRSPWKVYGLARRPRPEWLHSEAVYVQCDLLNRDEVLVKVAPLTDVTHLFWVTWVPRATEEENVVANEKAFRNVLDTLVPNAENLEHIALQTGGKHYMGSFKAAEGGASLHDTPYKEDMCRSAGPNFYYNLEDALFETVEKSKGKITWSVHRPGQINGVAQGNAMDAIGTIAIYASICKYKNLPFKFPGTELTWNGVAEAADADLVAEQELWAAMDSRGKNQAFNIMNGDQWRWRRVWKSIAEKLEVEYIPFDGTSSVLTESMKNMEPVWDQMVKEYGLQQTRLEDVGHWWFMDWTLRLPSDCLLSLNKSRERGFYGFRNTEKTILAVLDKMKERRLIP